MAWLRKSQCGMLTRGLSRRLERLLPRKLAWPRRLKNKYFVTALLLAFSLLFFKKRVPKHSEVVEESPRTKFAKAMEKARPQDVAKGGGEERALERQIEEKRNALRASASAFKGDVKSAEGVDEDAVMDGLLGQLDAFRKALEAQDERARIYAELVRLQNLKIETLERELGLGGKRSR